MPRAKSVAVFIDKRIVTENFFVLVKGVDVKNENSALLRKKRNEGEYLLYFVKTFEVIQTVKRAYGADDCAVKIKLCHILAQEEYVGIFNCRLLLCNRQHFGRHIGAYYGIPLFGEAHRERTRTARKVKQKPPVYSFSG